MYDVKDVQRALLASLKEIDRICKKHDISYCPDGGSLLGAVRHKGIIPWDDDIDVAFRRSEYERFLSCARGELAEGFVLVMPGELEHGAFFDFTPKIVNLGYSYDFPQEDLDWYGEILNHPAIDLFVLEEKPPAASVSVLQRQVLRCIYGMAMGHRRAQDYAKYSSPAQRAAVALLSRAGRYISIRTLYRMYERIAKLYARRSDKCTEYFASNYPIQFLQWTYKKSWYDDLIDCPFEDMTLRIPREYDALLRVEYGDYLRLPPENKRVPEHRDSLFKVF